MQGTTMFRARLPVSHIASLPNDESHMVARDGLLGVYYPISNVHCVWTVGVPDASLEGADVPPKPARIDATAAHDQAACLKLRKEAGNVTLQVCLANVWTCAEDAHHAQ